MTTRAEQQRATRTALSDAALALFDEHGYDAVTMGAIAKRAGVSRPTANRHFGTKAAILLAVTDEWLRLYGEAIHNRLPGETRLYANRRGFHAILSHIEGDRDRVAAMMRLSFGHPALEGAMMARSGYLARVIETTIRAETGDDLRTALFAGAIGGMFGSLTIKLLLANDPSFDAHAELDAGFDLLEYALTMPAR